MTSPNQYQIPQAAQGRLHHASQQHAATTSFFGYDSFLLYDQLGFESLGAVIGLSVMHIGRIQLAGIKQAVELDAHSQSLSQGRLTAIGRMQDEAALLGADGVICHTLVGERRFDAEEHEYSIQGTAVRFRPQPGALRTPSGRPFVYASSAQVLFEMLSRNYVPVAYGYGVCVYHVPHRSMRQAFAQTFQNVEIPLFTDAWYTAREIAVSRLQSMLEQQGARMVLNMGVDQEAEVFGEHTSEFRAHGAGWVRREGIAQLVPDFDPTVAGLIDKGLYVTSPLAR